MSDNDTPAEAWVRARALEIVDIGINADVNLFLNALALAAGMIMKQSFPPDAIDNIVFNLAVQIRSLAHGQGRPQ